MTRLFYRGRTEAPVALTSNARILYTGLQKTIMYGLATHLPCQEPTDHYTNDALSMRVVALNQSGFTSLVVTFW